MKDEIRKAIIKNIPYMIVGLLATNFGEAWRMTSQIADAGQRILMFIKVLPDAFYLFMPSFYPSDIVIGVLSFTALKIAVYIKGRNARRFRHNEEYGSARWGNKKDIAPFMDKDPMKNVILTASEGLMMSSRPKDPKNARNKNVLVIGGSGSGKTRFWVKPNLLQMHSSYVLTDPKGYTIRG